MLKGITVTKCDHFDTSRFGLGSLIDYKNSPHYQFKIGTTEKKFLDKFGFKFLPTSCMTIKNNILTLCFDNNKLTKKQQTYINVLKEMDNLFVRNKQENLKKCKVDSHPDLYIHTPIIKTYKDKTYINFNLMKTKEGDIATGFTKNEVVTSISKNFIGTIDAISTYKKYKNSYIVFKAIAKISKNGDHGKRDYGIRLVVLDVHLGEKDSTHQIVQKNINFNPDKDSIGISL